jgi:signal transduction histidine kinase
VQKARALVGASLDQARQVALQLRPPRIHEVGLGVAIHTLAGEAGIPVEVSFAASLLPPGALAPDQEIGLFRIVQEALANVARHSRAARAWVDADVTVERVGITVDDDGVGFDDSVKGRGLGLVGMAERAGILDGRLTVRSRPGAGTSVAVMIPRRSRTPSPGSLSRRVGVEETR